VAGNFADHGILAILVVWDVPEMLITILLVFLGFCFLDTPLRPGDAITYSESDYEESSSLEMFINHS
jgi:hypothetical protein